eukprot:611024_1
MEWSSISDHHALKIYDLWYSKCRKSHFQHDPAIQLQSIPLHQTQTYVTSHKKFVCKDRPVGNCPLCLSVRSLFYYCRVTASAASLTCGTHLSSMKQAFVA